MSTESELMLYLLVGVPLALVVIVLLAMGPLGWFAIGFLIIAVMAFRSNVEDPEDRSAPERQNCAVCGSPNSLDRDACDYCGEPI